MQLQKGRCVCALIIMKPDKLYLQLRDNKPQVSYPGQVGIFGGTTEEGETLEQTVRREMHEELEDYQLKNLNYLGEFNFNNKPVYCFYTKDYDFNPEKHKVLEGQRGVIISKHDLNKYEFAGATKEILTKFFNGEFNIKL
jgi:ADP-ribose pyrophosphatase YjhB (NUDIX family)